MSNFWLPQIGCYLFGHSLGGGCALVAWARNYLLFKAAYIFESVATCKCALEAQLSQVRCYCFLWRKRIDCFLCLSEVEIPTERDMLKLLYLHSCPLLPFLAQNPTVCMPQFWKKNMLTLDRTQQQWFRKASLIRIACNGSPAEEEWILFYIWSFHVYKEKQTFC